MRQGITALIAMIWLLLWSWNPASAQVPKTVTVGFCNQANMNVVVKGYTIVNGVQRGGQILQLSKTDGRAYENNVPTGVRYYTVYDVNFKILLRDHPVQVQNRTVSLEILPVPGNPNRVTIVTAP